MKTSKSANITIKERVLWQNQARRDWEKGLGALFADPVTPVEPQKQIQVLPIQKLEPNRAQPRRDF